MLFKTSYRRKQSVIALTTILLLLLIDPALIVADEPESETKPGLQITLIADPRFIPAHVPPPDQDEIDIQSATFNVTYNSFPTQAQTAFQRAVDIWASMIESDVTIDVEANWAPSGSSVLGSAGPTDYRRNFPGAAYPNTWYPIALANAITNLDLAPFDSDIETNFNSNINWYFGLDGNPPPNQYDFVTVVLHELGHGLGFSGSFEIQGGQGQLIGHPDIYDRFTSDANGTSLLSYANPSVSLAGPLQGNGPAPGGTFFDGASSRAANSNAPVKLYTPGSWEDGSSYSHLDENSYPPGNPHALMTPFMAKGESSHDPGEITLGIFKDIGWELDIQPDLSLTITPEPFPIEATTNIISYTLTLRNNTFIEISDVMITNTIPGSTTFTLASDGGSETSSGVVAWPSITSLNGHSSAMRTFTVNVTAPIEDGDSLINTVSVSTNQGLQIDNLEQVQIVGTRLIYIPLVVKP